MSSSMKRRDQTEKTRRTFATSIWPRLLALTFAVLIVGLIGLKISATDSFVINRHQFGSGNALKAPLRIAFLSDLHVRNTPDQFEKLDSILNVVEALNVDIILLGGDYTGEGAAETALFRDQLLEKMAHFPQIAPTYAILGNHEWWTANDWEAAITGTGIELIENQQRPLNFEQGRICLRGLGDAYAGHYHPLPFTDTCKGIPITLTHDPLAIESDDQSGLYLAGHTHCGQIRLPLIGAPWAPTRASEEYHCGVGAADNKVWLVSAGLGTSIIPARFGTTAAIELITLH